MQKRKLLLLLLLLFTAILISPKEAYAAAPVTNRLSGADRYATNIAITKNGWTGASDIVIASGEDFPDALCAAPLAKAKNAPIILAPKGQLSSLTIDEIKRLKAKNAYIIGGTGVISTNIEKQLEDLGITFIRLAGQNRYQTSVKVAELLGTNKGIVVATGENFPDALGIAPVSAKLGMPILLSPQGLLPAEVVDYLKGKNVPSSYVIGGTGVLSDKVKSSLSNAKRLSGSDRFETNTNIMKEFARELDVTSIYVASGSNFPDALSGSVLASKSNSPIVLVDATITQNPWTYLRNQNCRTVNILGGTGAVNTSIENALKSVIKYLTITKADDVTDYAFVNENYHFPENVLVTYEDTSTRMVPVKWNSSSLDTSKTGYHSFDGIISGYTGKVKLFTRVMTETSSIEGNHVNGGHIFYYKGELYYVNIAEGGKIYRHSRDNSPHFKINDDSSAAISVINDWIYYHNVSDGSRLYKIRQDGTGRTKVTEEQISNYAVVGDWIYYSCYNDGKGGFYRMKTDGTNKTMISSEMVAGLTVYDDYLYFTNGSDGFSIWKTKLDGSGRMKVSGDTAYFINVADNWIYYRNSSDNGKLYKIKTDGTGKVVVSDDSVQNINVHYGWVYYSNLSDGEKLYRVRVDGTDRTKFLDTNVVAILTLGEEIVYETYNNVSYLRIVKLDASVESRFAIPFVYDKEPNNSISNAIDYKLINYYEHSSVISGNLQKGDVDLYRIQPGYSEDLNIQFLSKEIWDNAVITLLDKSGNPIGSMESDETGRAFASIPSIEPGTYYIKISTKQGSIPATNLYRVTAWLKQNN